MVRVFSFMDNRPFESADEAETAAAWVLIGRRSAWYVLRKVSRTEYFDEGVGGERGDVSEVLVLALVLVLDEGLDLRTTANFHARLCASAIPVLAPCPAYGGI